MRTHAMPLSSNPVARAESRSSNELLRLLVTAALSASAGALVIAVLDRVAGSSAPPRAASVAVQVPVAVGGRDPSVPDAGSVFFGREVVLDEPVATF